MELCIKRTMKCIVVSSPSYIQSIQRMAFDSFLLFLMQLKNCIIFIPTEFIFRFTLYFLCYFSVSLVQPKVISLIVHIFQNIQTYPLESKMREKETTTTIANILNEKVLRWCFPLKYFVSMLLK